MTRIEKLEIQGFKSFAKKTLLTFPNNFSVICGPNGSGKSNVLDAICFVLGRKSAKSLRADRLMEMVFHGTTTRPASELAKVSIYFDNTKREFPFDDDRLVVSRRVNKKGVSMYKLNGRTVTREKIQEVLRPVRIQSDGYNIILQGDITEIVEMNPMERREIIDEISGISEFDQKRDKAQHELMTVEDRLKESHIVLNEKRSSIDRLENEAKDAQKHKRLTESLEKARASLSKHKLVVAEKAMETLNEKIGKMETQDIELDVENIDKELEGVEKELDQIDKRLFDRTKDIAIIKEVEKLRSDISRRKDRADMARHSIKRIEEVINRLEALKQKEREGSSSRAVTEVMKLGLDGVYGTVASLITVPNKYQTAIEVTAGPHLNDIIVSNQDVAVKCVNFLKANRIGRATFLPLDKIRERDSSKLRKFKGEKGVIGIALDLIEYDQRYYHAFSFVFGETLVADRIETVRSLGIGKTRYVTLDGDLVERSGAIIGGFYRKKNMLVGKDETEKYKEEMANLQKEIEETEMEVSVMDKKLANLTTEEKMGDKELVNMQKRKHELEGMLDSLEGKKKKMFRDRMSQQEDINRLRISKARLEAELENIKLEFSAFENTELIEAAPSVLERRILDTTLQIKALGLINMKALEEFEQQKNIYDQLKERVDKLTEERNKILEIIAEIEGRRIETFNKTLERLREEFKIVFKDLMSGPADLRLIGGLDSGLLIEGSAKGKKLMNIDLMSGGEKTLTALAFLFAIQRFRPAPFYVLDEIDAALDKPNSKKAIDLINKYSDSSQFIVISHNEATIQAAGCVYGVSMENGESRLVGIKMPA
ncbi:MAG: chromosome segregation SMC family protein [Candidatus Aenigmatarchaeota archaeon]